VVANADGVRLLQAGTSPHAARIAALLARYDNIAFLACSRSLEKLRLKGIDVHLLPDVGVVPGALEEIVARLQEGWVYVRI
jgi:intracellular sulfur oxidation DsrE/DsrF family protein